MLVPCTQFVCYTFDGESAEEGAGAASCAQSLTLCVLVAPAGRTLPGGQAVLCMLAATAEGAPALLQARHGALFSWRDGAPVAEAASGFPEACPSMAHAPAPGPGTRHRVRHCWQTEKRCLSVSDPVHGCGGGGCAVRER